MKIRFSLALNIALTLALMAAIVYIGMLHFFTLNYYKTASRLLADPYRDRGCRLRHLQSCPVVDERRFHQRVVEQACI